MTTTFQSNSSVVSKPIRPEPDRNLSNGHIETRSLDGQGSTGAGPDIAVRNESVSENDDTAKWTDMSMFQ